MRKRLATVACYALIVPLLPLYFAIIIAETQAVNSYIVAVRNFANRQQRLRFLSSKW